ncbi:uncharacterized protein LOC113317363 isoform X2 [Papaver somniferum]|uniref:uncharacterized protein LOC113317363 isoform X2 n=1 Tax=Papaver somniferum TaxID=3469 RepID=UPI000E704219|nr:uncharacterized protein LOC113317363 isoform X2 [Papaver somniferum]
MSKKYGKNYQLKKTRGDDEGDSIQTGDSNCSRQMEDDLTGIQPPANDTSSDRIVEGGSANTGTKREKIKRMESSKEPKSLTRIREPVVGLESLEHYKSKCFELSVELEKKKVECTELQGKLAEVETRKTAAKDEIERTPEDATEHWRKMYSDLESRVLRIENQLESRVSNLESLVLRNGKGSSILRCVELHNAENMEAEARGLQNEVTQSGEKQKDKNSRSIPNVENNNGGGKDSHVYELKTEEKVLVYDVGINKHRESESEFPRYSAVNMSCGSLDLSSRGENIEEGKGWGYVEERPSQHGSLSQDHLEMSQKPFVNVVSCSGGESFGESFAEDSDSDLMDMMAMKYRTKNKDREIKWKFEADMLSSFEEDPELCMKAVCALYRQQISEDEISANGLFHYSDALSGLCKSIIDRVGWHKKKNVIDFTVIVR